MKTFQIDFASVQEHFKKNVGTFFDTNFPEFSNFVVPAVRAPMQDKGRPKGGLAQIHSSKFKIKSERINCDNPRIQAQILKFANINLLWINTYFPTDPQHEHFDDTELRSVLKHIEEIMEEQDFDHILLNGDINWHRERNNSFCKIIEEFVEKTGILSIWDKFPVSHTHVHTDNKSVSTLDHFLMDPELAEVVVAGEALHLGDNLSRHSPIMIKLNISTLPSQPKKEAQRQRKPAWYKANQQQREDFVRLTEQKLSSLKRPSCLDCSNPHCNVKSHSCERDGHLLDMMGCVIEASIEALPKSGGGPARPNHPATMSEVIPGWTDKVEPRRQDALFWHAVWQSAGRPNRGVLQSIMASTRNKYHYAIRSVRRDENTIRARRLWAANQAGPMNLIQEMKSIKGAKKGNKLPETVAGKSNEGEIVEEFRKVYQELYNLEDDFEALKILRCSLEEDVDTEDSKAEIKKVTVETVIKAATRLKPSKGDVSGSYNSDMIKNCPESFFKMLSEVFQSWLTHGTVTKSFLACAFLPLVKGMKDPSLTASYRAVAGSSLVLKLFDYVILEVWGEKMASDSLQFGYKCNTSTTECSWLVTSVAEYFHRRGSPIMITTLDAKQGFDCCSWLKIFESLRSRVPAVVTRALMYVYIEQTAHARWGSARSSQFKLSNSTRQGSVISPAIWCIYLEELILRLRLLGLGCRIQGIFLGVTVYADDVILQAPSRGALARMLKETEAFAQEFKIIFSTHENSALSKSKCIWMCGKVNVLNYPAPLILNGRPLPWVTSAAHLGHEISQTCKTEHSAWVARAKFIDKSVSLQEMFNFAKPAEVLAAISIYACDFYGSNLWNLYGERAGQLYRAYNTSVKLSWGLPRSTHTWLVTSLLGCGLPTARERILSGYTGFLARLTKSASFEVRVMAEMETRDASSTIGLNIYNFRNEFGVDPRSVTPKEVKTMMREVLPPVHPEEEWKLHLLEEMLQERELLKAEGREEETDLVQSFCEILCEA